MNKVICISGMAAILCFAGQATPQDLTRLQIGDGKDWSFLNGQWGDGPEAALVPPDGGGKEYMAVWHKREYSDVRARFRFQFRNSNGGARFLFRVRDSMRYYALDIPWCGQQNRVRHFWAGILLADGTPLQRYLQFQMVLGVAPEHNRWYEARVEATGPRIRAWIEGRLAADVEDRTYAKGRVGLMGLITAGKLTPHFANLEVGGASASASRWAGLTPPPEHWIIPCRKVNPQTHQSYPNLVKSKSGALTASIPFGNPGAGEMRETVWVRSKDAGRTWSDPMPATAPHKNGLGSMFVKTDGTWVSVHSKPDGSPQERISRYESKDEGQTWSGPTMIRVVGEWPKELTADFGPSAPPLRLRDGALLLPVMATLGAASGGQYFQKTTTNYVFRSTDDGETWAAPVRCDRNNPQSPRANWFLPGNFSELGIAEVSDNVIFGLGRPGPWPYMWQVESRDGGRSWEPAAFGPIPGYCPTLVRTASGALVAVKRFPYTSANVSLDGGKTWDAGTIIDTPIWANQKMVEAEPDVVLVLYMGHMVQHGQPDNRIARLRVTRKGLVVDR
ncbi:MAG: sialidase family protein [Bryobacteraceae bacterium]